METLVLFYLLTGILVAMMNASKFWIGVWTILFWWPVLLLEALKRCIR